MPFRTRNIARETVTALALLSIYMLVLLAPLHQAAGLQRDLAKLGYTPLDSWSICSALAPPAEDGKPDAVVKCAAAGIGKNELAAIHLPTIESAILRTSKPVRYAQWHMPVVSELDWPSGPPRAPPMSA